MAAGLRMSTFPLFWAGVADAAATFVFSTVGCWRLSWRSSSLSLSWLLWLSCLAATGTLYIMIHNYWPTKQFFFFNSYSPTMSQTQYLPQITASWLMLLSATRGIFVTIDFHWCQHCPNFNHVVIFVTVSSAFFFSLPSGSSWSCSVSRSTW